MKYVSAFNFPLPHVWVSPSSFIMHTSYQLAAAPNLASVAVHMKRRRGTEISPLVHSSRISRFWWRIRFCFSPSDEQVCYHTWSELASIERCFWTSHPSSMYVNTKRFATNNVTMNVYYTLNRSAHFHKAKVVSFYEYFSRQDRKWHQCRGWG